MFCNISFWIIILNHLANFTRVVACGWSRSMDLELESESHETISLIKVSDSSIHEFSRILKDIRHILSGRLQFIIGHVFREANNCANILIKMGACGSSRLCLWEAPPFKLSTLLFTDFTSMVYLLGVSLS